VTCPASYSVHARGASCVPAPRDSRAERPRLRRQGKGAVSRLRKMRLIVFDQFSYSFSIVFSLFLIYCFNAHPGQAPQAQSGVGEHQRSPDTNLGSTRLANAICSCCISQVRFRSDCQIDNNNSRHGDQNPPNVTSPPHVRRIPYA
jgi:hypothetical protein